jgi:hypothetical protein
MPMHSTLGTGVKNPELAVGSYRETTSMAAELPGGIEDGVNVPVPGMGLGSI